MSSILLLLREQQLEHFNQVKSFLPVMLNNLKLIKRELENKTKAYRSIATLRFVAMYKFYEAVTSLSKGKQMAENNCTGIEPYSCRCIFFFFFFFSFTFKLWTKSLLFPLFFSSSIV